MVCAICLLLEGVEVFLRHSLAYGIFPTGFFSFPSSLLCQRLQQVQQISPDMRVSFDAQPASPQTSGASASLVEARQRGPFVLRTWASTRGKRSSCWFNELIVKLLRCRINCIRYESWSGLGGLPLDKSMGIMWGREVFSCFISSFSSLIWSVIWFWKKAWLETIDSQVSSCFFMMKAQMPLPWYWNCWAEWIPNLSACMLTVFSTFLAFCSTMSLMILNSEFKIPGMISGSGIVCLSMMSVQASNCDFAISIF